MFCAQTDNLIFLGLPQLRQTIESNYAVMVLTNITQGSNFHGKARLSAAPQKNTLVTMKNNRKSKRSRRKTARKIDISLNAGTTEDA